MEKVRAARQNEMEGFMKRRVYSIVPRRTALDKGAKIIGVRWVDTLNADDVRSRLVAQDFKKGKGQCDEMFAPTPPLLASRWLCSQMASGNGRGPGNKCLMALDFSKAFLYGMVDREVYIELPAEDGRRGRWRRGWWRRG